MTFLDGRRHDMPLKDGYADYLMVEGFPKSASEEEPVSECLRVLKKRDGHLIIRIPSVMTIEKKPNFSNLAEFSSKMFYNFSNKEKDDKRKAPEGNSSKKSLHRTKARRSAGKCCSLRRGERGH
jgi:pyruvate-formate lyase-activating enzyme